MQGAHVFHLADAFLDEGDAVADAAAVHLQLGFTGAAGADAAAKARQRQALAHNARQGVLQLRQLYLQLALVSAGTLGENVQNQGRSIQHAHAHSLLDIALLRRRELVVEDAQINIFLLHI